MPFLRAANIPAKKAATATPRKPCQVCDERIMEAVRAWIREDDTSTNAELAILGLL